MGIGSCFAALRSGLFLFSALIASSAVAHAQANDLVAKGQYIFALAAGCACHTPPKETFHVGARAFPIPFGTVYSTNITQDKATGLGAWTDQQIHDAMVKGIRRDGSRILPAMPYEAYSGMAEEDLKALIAYLRTLKPVRKENLRPKVHVSLFRPLVTPLWLKLFGRFSTPPSKTPQSGVERGRYLVEHVSLCGDCHTPRNFLMVPNRALHLAGIKKGPFGEEMRSRNDIAELLLTGTKPDLDNVQGLMAELIEAGYKNMKKEDALAIADYLKSVPAIKNKVE
ncbi:MAG: cytochrome c [Deltaproteobacteria bacterium]|nr:cytochrome c [Deltaproteobacteria bacterium]